MCDYINTFIMYVCVCVAVCCSVLQSHNTADMPSDMSMCACIYTFIMYVCVCVAVCVAVCYRVL